jgi:hypothetical protein
MDMLIATVIAVTMSFVAPAIPGALHPAWAIKGRDRRALRYELWALAVIMGLGGLIELAGGKYWIIPVDIGLPLWIFYVFYQHVNRKPAA